LYQNAPRKRGGVVKRKGKILINIIHFFIAWVAITLRSKFSASPATGAGVGYIVALTYGVFNIPLPATIRAFFHVLMIA